MSAYIYCPECRDDSLDVDTLCCDCGFDVHGRIAALEKENAKLMELAFSQDGESYQAKWAVCFGLNTKLHRG